MTIFLQALCVVLVAGCFFAGLIWAYLYLANDRDLDELDYDNGHPDGFVRHFAADKREVRR